jgi:hypothetical protein
VYACIFFFINNVLVLSSSSPSVNHAVVIRGHFHGHLVCVVKVLISDLS